MKRLTTILLACSALAYTPTKHEFAVSQIREGSQFEYVRFVRDGELATLVVVLRLSDGDVAGYVDRGADVVLESDDGSGNWRDRARRKPASRIEFKLPGDEPVMLLRVKP